MHDATSAPALVREEAGGEAPSDARPFTDNVTFLETKADEIRLLLRRAVLVHGAPADGSAASEERSQGPDDDLDAIRRRLGDVRAATGARLRVSSPEDIPFLSLVRQFGLDPLSQDVIWVLFFCVTSPDFRQAFRDSQLWRDGRRVRGDVQAGAVLGLLFPGDFRRQLAARSVFGRDKPLIDRYLVSAIHDLPGPSSILELELALFPRVVQWITGDTTEYSATAVFVSDRPTTDLANVILPDEVVGPILRLVEGHDEYVRLRTSLGIDSVVEYGRSVVILEYGPSGTGKTLLARALSHRTGRRLLSLPEGAVSNERGWRRPGWSDSGVLDALFREAQLQNGIVFVDECDQVCGKDSPFLREFLLELEKSDVLVIMATNRPHELPAALDRRITLKVPFEIPSPPLRRRIWELLLPDRVPLAADVDLEHLARKYPLAGGYIKNAVLMALNFAVSRGLGDDVVLTQADLEAAAGFQERRVAGGSVLGELRAPAITLKECAVPGRTRSRLEALARAVRHYDHLCGRLCIARRPFDSSRQGVKVLFHGPDYGSAVAAAEAVADEVPLRIRSVPLGGITSQVEESARSRRFREPASLFDGAALLLRAEGGQVLIITDEAGLLDRHGHGPENGVLREALRQVADLDGIVFVVSAASRLRADASCIRFHDRVRFDTPDAAVRAQHWRRSLAGVLGPNGDIDTAALGRDYPLDFAGIEWALQRACLVAARQGPDGALDMRRLAEAARYVCRHGARGRALFGDATTA